MYGRILYAKKTKLNTDFGCMILLQVRRKRSTHVN